MAQWIITYRDNSTFSDEDGPPNKAPTYGVICITIADISCGNYIIAEQNYYCWHHDAKKPQWVPHDDIGLKQYLHFCANDGFEPLVLCGYWIPRDEYAAIRIAAQTDPRLPPITAGPPRQPEGN